MSYGYFAGAIFTLQEVVIFCLIAFIIISILSGIVIFVTKYILGKFRIPGTNGKLSVKMAILIGFGLVTAVTLLFLILPAIIKDSSWKWKQQQCAEQAGYNSPIENDSDRATAKSQAVYRTCIDG